jgi:TrmH family RNA methyltransferase
MLAASSHQGVALPEANWKLPAAIFIGNEGAGISHELLHQMDETVFIPQSIRVESLNAGVAASIILYEMARQRREAR